LASRGIPILSLPLRVLAFMVAGIALYAFLLDFHKLVIFRWFRIVS